MTSGHRVTAATITDDQIRELLDFTDWYTRDIETEDYRYTTPEAAFLCYEALETGKPKARRLCAEIYNEVLA